MHPGLVRQGPTKSGGVPGFARTGQGLEPLFCCLVPVCVGKSVSYSQMGMRAAGTLVGQENRAFCRAKFFLRAKTLFCCPSEERKGRKETGKDRKGRGRLHIWSAFWGGCKPDAPVFCASRHPRGRKFVTKLPVRASRPGKSDTLVAISGRDRMLWVLSCDVCFFRELGRGSRPCRGSLAGLWCQDTLPVAAGRERHGKEETDTFNHAFCFSGLFLRVCHEFGKCPFARS